MRRAARRRIVLLGTVAVLLALALLQYARDRRADPGPLLALDPATVSQVEVRFGRATPERYVKRAGHWWRSDGSRADDGRLQEMAAIAQAPVVRWRPSSDFDPARIGLAPPWARLRLDGRTIDFGTSAVTGPLRYVRVGARVALIPLRYTPRQSLSAVTRAP